MSRVIARSAFLAALVAVHPFPVARTAAAQQPATVRLPEPGRDGAMSLEAALRARRSTRAFTRDSIGLVEVAQLLWAAQGANRPDGHRTAPSAGATYPLEALLLPVRVAGLPAGTWRYRVDDHALQLGQAGDAVPAFLASAARQPWIADAAAILVITGVPERTARRYGERAERYLAIEVGHAAQNVALQAAALGLGTTYVGSFSDSAVARILALPAGERPYAVLPVGRPR